MAWDANAKYRLLLQLNNAILSQTTREGLFQAVSTEIHKIVHFDRMSINLYDAKTSSLRYFATAAGVLPAGIGEIERPLAKGAIAMAIIRSGQPLVIMDLSTHVYWESVRLMRDAGLKSVMAFPMIVRDEIIGTVHFSFKKTPSDPDDLMDILQEVCKQVAIAVDNMEAQLKLKAINDQLSLQKDFLMTDETVRPASGEIFYASQAMTDVMRQATMFARSDAAVAITGETGTGKDLIASYIHNRSVRRDALFVKVNCPALTSTLFESELFGHAKGAFSGASAKRVGRFEMADGGTIFLDEIAELYPNLQAKLLQVLQDGVFERVGESRPIKVDFRLISATNKDLGACIKDKSFRADLYYRLNTVSIFVPPLRERLDDIPILVDRLAAAQAFSMRLKPPLFSDASLKAMRNYPWPGNVRELKNLINRMAITRPGQLIEEKDIRPFLNQPAEQTTAVLLGLAEAEREHIVQALIRTKGIVGGPQGAASLLKLPRQTLQYRMKKYGLSPRSFQI